MVGKAVPQSEKAIAELLKALKSIRNDLVHSQLRFAPVDGKLHAIVINAQDAAKTARPGRVVALEDFKVLNSQIAEVRRSIA